MHIIVCNLQTLNGNQLKFWKQAVFIYTVSSDSCHKKMLLELLNFPLINIWLP